jgi:hypothetical protein
MTGQKENALSRRAAVILTGQNIDRAMDANRFGGRDTPRVS